MYSHKKILKSYQKGYFPVSDGHKLYYELYGNPKGKPVIYVHGGPGARFHPTHKRYFDPKIFNVLFFEQRGAGRSKPFANLHANTTPKLVEDIRVLMDHFQFKKAILFGGSWGTTLSLAYALKYPHRVAGLHLRMIFLGSKWAIDHYVGGGIKEFFPEAWERFVSPVPFKYKRDVVSYYWKQMQSKNNKIKEKFTYEWAYYEVSISRLQISEKEIRKTLKEWSYKSLAPVEAHYMKHGCFLSEDYILNNASSLSSIPTTIIHGRYDFICPPKGAYLLHKNIKNSRLHLVCMGHNPQHRTDLDTLIIAELELIAKMAAKRVTN